MLRIISEKKSQLDELESLPLYTLKSLREKLFLEWTYHTNAMESNSLTMMETKVVLEGITVGGKKLREHLEVINHWNAIMYIEEIVQSKKPFSKEQIKNVHRIILKGIDDAHAGMYREKQVFIPSAVHTPPPPDHIIEKMEQMINWYNGEGIHLHPVKCGAKLYAIFIGIYPFIHGNGRTARLLLNLKLMKAGYPPAIIKIENQLNYYKALDKAHTKNDYQDFVSLIEHDVNDSLDLYLNATQLESK